MPSRRDSFEDVWFSMEYGGWDLGKVIRNSVKLKGKVGAFLLNTLISWVAKYVGLQHLNRIENDQGEGGITNM